jgi:hypothetical protein
MKCFQDHLPFSAVMPETVKIVMFTCTVKCEVLEYLCHTEFELCMEKWGWE